ncbi:MAG TPA: dihydrofolate reductase [Candidatus Didemnitutus sp.]
MAEGLLNLIVACSENRVIGRNGRLPFDIPEDKEWFHQQTAGAACILGRICFETWPKVLADDRAPVVVTRNRALASPRVHVVADVPAAIAVARTLGREIMICGGQRIYEETLPLADRLILTLVHANVDGDTYFPEWRGLAWKETWRREGADASFRYTFLILDRSGERRSPLPADA